MPAHLLHTQTWENLNLPSLKHSWVLWRKRCALHCEGKSIRVVVPNHVPGDPPTLHVFHVTLIKPDSDHQLISRDSKAWIRGVRQRWDAKCAVLGGLQERGWEPLH